MFNASRSQRSRVIRAESRTSAEGQIGPGETTFARVMKNILGAAGGPGITHDYRPWQNGPNVTRSCPAHVQASASHDNAARRGLSEIPTVRPLESVRVGSKMQIGP